MSYQLVLPHSVAHPVQAPGPPQGWWTVPGHTCIAAYQPKGAASYAVSLRNLANPGTNNAAEGVAPTWATGTGWTFDGTNDWLDTGITPSGGGWTLIVQFANLGVPGEGYGAVAGEYDPSGGGRSLIVLPYSGSGNLAEYWNGNGNSSAAPRLLTGNGAVAGQQGYRDGIADGGAVPAWGTGAAAYTIAIGCHNGAARAGYAPVEIRALAIYGSTLDAGEIATLAAAMAAL